MPFKPKKPCRHPGCPELTNNRFCNTHQKEYERRRGSASERGYDKRWQAIRKRYLSAFPLCVECNKQGKLVEATEVHHINPLRDGGTHDYDNLMPLCKSCHSGITGRQQREYRY